MCWCERDHCPEADHRRGRSSDRGDVRGRALGAVRGIGPRSATCLHHVPGTRGGGHLGKEGHRPHLRRRPGALHPAGPGGARAPPRAGYLLRDRREHRPVPAIHPAARQRRLPGRRSHLDPSGSDRYPGVAVPLPDRPDPERDPLADRPDPDLRAPTVRRVERHRARPDRAPGADHHELLDRPQRLEPSRHAGHRRQCRGGGVLRRGGRHARRRGAAG